MKYSGRIATAFSLGSLLQQQFRYFFSSEDFDAILPVPLHLRRLRERGFNQSVLLARPLAHFLRVPLEIHSVERTRNTPPQSGFSATARRTNLLGAFSVSLPNRIRERAILILDDVYTTGSTIDSLAKTLLAAGARKVDAFTLARTRQADASLSASS